MNGALLQSSACLWDAHIHQVRHVPLCLKEHFIGGCSWVGHCGRRKGRERRKRREERREDGRGVRIGERGGERERRKGGGRGER